MKKTIFALLSVAISISVWAEHKQYIIQPGDSLTQILRSKNYAQGYKELLPFINETVQLNPQAFKNNNPDLIVPDIEIRLPKNPNEPEPISEPEPEPEPDPEPIPEPEPKPEAIGSIKMLKGISEVLHETETIAVTRQQDLYVDDAIFTQDNSRAEINLVDDTSFTLGPNSHFIVNEFSFTQSQPENEASKDSLIATIHKGVLRIVTGLIGKNKENQLAIKSAFTSTIGVRGTDFTVRTCIQKEECGDLYGVSAAVSDGGINLKNKTSQLALNKNEFAQVKSATEPPKKAPLPEGFFDLDRDVSDIKVNYSWWQKAIDRVTSFF